MRNAVAADLAQYRPPAASTAAQPFAAEPPSLCAVVAAGAGPLPSGVEPVARRPGETVTALTARLAADGVLIWAIAPETGGALAALCAAVPSPQWLGCAAAAIDVAGSKHATLARLQAAGLPTPLAHASPGASNRWVVKPDDGAGADDTRVHATREQAQADLAARTRRGRVATLEPWVDGAALSLSLVSSAAGAELVSVNRQHIAVDADGALHFRGVDIDVPFADAQQRAQLAAMAHAVWAALPGLRGFVGIDLVWHTAHGPVLIEVNPRTTSAYVGLSAALGRNLAADVLQAHLAAHVAPRDRQAIDVCASV